MRKQTFNFFFFFSPPSCGGGGVGGGINFKTSIQKFWKESIKKVNPPHPNPLPQGERELIEIGLMPYPELVFQRSKSFFFRIMSCDKTVNAIAIIIQKNAL